MPDGVPAVVLDDVEGRRHAALAVSSRRRLLEALRSAGRPADVSELAAALGLHVTTARAHLRVLTAVGLVRRVPQQPVARGRPPHLYEHADTSPGESRERLAELLAGALDSGGEEGRRHAEDAGRRWAEQQLPASGALSREESVGGLVHLFDRLGFAPRRTDVDPGAFRIELERCPFRDVARAHPQVVCSVHLGLMREALSRMGQPGIADVVTLRPFVTPESCLAEGGARPADTRSGPSGPLGVE